MEPDQIRDLVSEAMPEAQVTVGGDGYHHELRVVSAAFCGMNRVKRQQLVYGHLAEVIRSGALHAVNIRAQTPEEAAATGG